MIPVTKTFFPPREEYELQLKRIWENQWLTNRGALVNELEDKLKNYLNVSKLILTTNGTLPIQIALKVFGENGEIITTPFSYVATTSAIVWENCKPVFVDIHPEYLTIDETKIESAITENTTAILATHVFGNPCNVEVIQKIANLHNLKVIYDAAHCFGVKYKDKSIFEYGDASTCSFHATKLFHTAEGGAVFCDSESLKHEFFYRHNFGHNGPEDFYGLGINAKMSELQAAMGLSVLPHMEEILEARKKIVNCYESLLDFSKLHKLVIRDNCEWNYSYYPVIFESETQLLAVLEKLNENDIYPRRYFFPSLNTLSYLEPSHMPISERISSTIMCLPLYTELQEVEAIKITNIINEHV